MLLTIGVAADTFRAINATILKNTSCIKDISQMHEQLGFYYRLQSELRRRIVSDQAEGDKVPLKREPAVTEFTMFVRLVVVVGGLILAVSLIMGSIQ
jgi:hypothetical protein